MLSQNVSWGLISAYLAGWGVAAVFDLPVRVTQEALKAPYVPGMPQNNSIRISGLLPTPNPGIFILQIAPARVAKSESLLEPAGSTEEQVVPQGQGLPWFSSSLLFLLSSHAFVLDLTWKTGRMNHDKGQVEKITPFFPAKQHEPSSGISSIRTGNLLTGA